MSSLQPYTPLWPETTVFIGAGATAALGMPMTEKLGAFFCDMAKAKDADDRRQRLQAWDSKPYFLAETRDVLLDLLELLAPAEKDHPRLAELSDGQRKILDRLYPGVDERQRLETVISLRRYYSWDSLTRVILSTPECGNQGDFLRDLFNLLDMHLLTDSGLPVCGSQLDDAGTGDLRTEGKFLQKENLRSARDCLVLFINLLFACAYRKLRSADSDYAPYVEAGRSIARMMQAEGRGLQGISALNDRRFYLHSAAFISMNFDPLFISFLLSATDEINRDRSAWVSTDGVAEPLKVALDLGHVGGVRPVGAVAGDASRVWYPFNESVAQRLNDPEHPSARRIRIAKFYFPHGNSNTRLCPNCGKTSLHLGASWHFPDPNLFPPSVLKGLDWGYQPRTKNEEVWRERYGHVDAVQCFYCGERTGARDNAMVMQTSFKGANSPAISETQNEIRALLERTEHVVLLGYSLPKDDVIWRAFLAARKGAKKRELFCSVVVGCNPKQLQWLSDKALDTYYDSLSVAERANGGYETITSAREVFGKERVRAYVGGIPSVFNLAGSYDESMRRLLYPDDWGPKFPSRWWERRSSSGGT